MYSSTSSMSSNHYLLDCFPAPPPTQTQTQTQTQHVSFPMSHLRSGPSFADSPAAAAAATAAAAAAALGPLTPRSAFVALPEIDIASSSFAAEFSSPSGALGLLHIASSSPSSSSSSSPPYSPHAVISLGEEWTDEESSSDRPASLDVFGDSDSYFAFSPTSSSSSLSPQLTTEQLPLWQAEHARLLSIRDAVLSSERAARYREACLESEVARIKDDLARVKEARARARWVASRAGSSSRRNSTPDANQARPVSAPLVRRASDSDVAVHHRPIEWQWQQHSSSSSSASSGWFSCDDDEEQITIDDDNAPIPLPVPAESAGQFWDEHYPDPETMLANNLTEARSARAEERRRRKRDHERIRELGILLSLGSEVRQWEERLAWENAFRDNDTMELDHVEDAASRRRSKSLPTTPASDGSSASTSSSALTPPLPPLSASPLWRVSAEMILRRRSLSERPRRVTPLIAIPFTHESEVSIGTSTGFGSSGGSDSDSDSGSSSSSSISGGAKHQAVLSPISITSPCVASSLKTAPSRPSALKLSFTLEDLVAPEEAAVVEKTGEDTRRDEEMCCNSSEESSDASDSDDSRCKSSSSNSSSSENENDHEGEKRLALRRGRSRWSWRRSLQSAQQLQLQQQLQQIVVDMEVDDA